MCVAGQCVAGQAPDNAQPMAASGSSGSADVDIVGLDQQDDADSADSGHVPPGILYAVLPC